MIKKISLIAMLCVLLLCGCVANVSDGGMPTPESDGEYEWSEAVSTPNVHIKLNEAEALLSELIPIMNDMSSGTLYISDIAYMSKASSYLAQFKQLNSEIAYYMHSVGELLGSYCSLYARNIGTDAVRQQINSYKSTYDSMSEEFRRRYESIEAKVLLDIMNKIELMAGAANVTASAAAQSA